MPEVFILLKAKDEASGIIKGIAKESGDLKSALLGAGLLGVTAIAGIGVGLGKLAYDAAQLEPVRITFDNLTESIGSSADEMLNALKPATMGVVSEADLMKAANKLMAMGLADSAEEAAQLAEMAVTLGVAMGEDAVPALESFTLMLANQSIPRLDTFGISSGKVRERIDELMKSTEGMTREEAFMIAVLDEGNKSMDKAGDITGTAAVKMGAFQTKVKDAKDDLGEALLPVLETLLDEAIGPLIEMLADDLIPIMAEHLPGAITATIEVFRTLADLIGDILEAIQALDKWTAEHLAPPEMRGYMGRVAGTEYTQSYMGPTEGGRWGQRVEINVHGLPGVADYIRDAIETEGGHTIGPGI